MARQRSCRYSRSSSTRLNPPLVGEPEAKPPTVVLPSIRPKNYFKATARRRPNHILTLMRELLISESPGVIALFTMRSDSYDRLETAKALDGISPLVLNLSPLPKGSYQAVIEGPAARLRESPSALKIEPALTQALLEDIESGGGSDALPLLAFTLERLYLDYGGRGSLTSRITMHSDASAAPSRPPSNERSRPLTRTRIPRDRAARLTLLRRGLVPWLAGIDSETGSPRRRVARLSDIPAEARPLIELARRPAAALD